MTTEAESAPAEALAERVLAAKVATMDLVSIYIGDRLGFYRTLAERDCTPAELADATGTSERYVREWLEQQAVTGILEVDYGAVESSARRYHLPAAYAEALLDPDSPTAAAPLARLMVGILRPLPALLEAFRTGSGVPYADYGPDTREGISGMNRPMFVNELGTNWLPAIPDVHARLRAEPSAHVADIACGAGWSSISIARAYPSVRVDGFDLDEPSIELARANAVQAGVADRVSFEVHDASDPALTGQYDLVTIFEAVHDMSRPVEALKTVRRLLSGGAAAVIADERVAEGFNAPGDELERLMYGYSVLHCLPVGLAEQPSVATGTVMRPDTLRTYAEQAGFRGIEILPIENDFWRFYRLVS